MRDVKLAKAIKLSRSIFDTDQRVADEGLFKNGTLHFDVPEGCNLIVLAGNKGGGYVPYRCLLPHQVYVDDLQEAFDKHHFEAIFVLPVRSGESFLIAGKGNYGLNRWQKMENKQEVKK